MRFWLKRVPDTSYSSLYVQNLLLERYQHCKCYMA